MARQNLNSDAYSQRCENPTPGGMAAGRETANAALKVGVEAGLPLFDFINAMACNQRYPSPVPWLSRNWSHSSMRLGSEQAFSYLDQKWVLWCWDGHIGRSVHGCTCANLQLSYAKGGAMSTISLLLGFTMGRTPDSR